jgi:hypothetical protein
MLREITSRARLIIPIGDWKPWRKTNSAPQEMDPDLEYQNARIAFVSQNLSPDPAEEEIAD